MKGSYLDGRKNVLVMHRNHAHTRHVPFPKYLRIYITHNYRPSSIEGEIIILPSVGLYFWSNVISLKSIPGGYSYVAT